MNLDKRTAVRVAGRFHAGYADRTESSRSDVPASFTGQLANPHKVG